MKTGQNIRVSVSKLSAIFFFGKVAKNRKMACLSFKLEMFCIGFETFKTLCYM